MSNYGGFNSGGGGGFLGMGGGGDLGGTPQQGKWGDGSVYAASIGALRNATQEHPDAPFFVGGKQLSRVIVVGRVHKKADATSNLQLLVEDGTGSMDCHLYIDEDDQTDVKNKVQEGTYVKVIGTLRSFNEKRSVKANRVIPIEKFDEVTHHLLSAMHHKLSLNQASSFGGMSGAPQLGVAATSTTYGAPGMNAGVGSTGGSIQSRVLDLISMSNEDAGVSVRHICDQLSLPESEVRAAIDNLCSDGRAYSTIDDDHFKSVS